MTGVFAKNAKKTKKSPALADLETDYGVLAYQLARYDKTLAVCQHSHPTNSCIKPFAEHAEQEFARFERRLTSNIFPAATQTQVEKIRATARHLTKLYQQFNAGATTAQTLTKIAAATIALNHEYTTLVRELS